MRRELNDFEINEIKERAREKLGICRKSNEIIGTQVFSVLGRYARAIYYPLGKEAPWGFTRISGSRNDAELEKPFVAINTSIPITCQVFAAAHELYHIWYEQDPDVLPKDLLEESEKEVSEKKANRFAAEFLVDELLLRRELDECRVKTVTIKEILQMAEVFTVPYRAMVKRLYEIGFIRPDDKNRFLTESDEVIDQYRRKYAFQLGAADERIAVDNLAELSANAYEAGLITFEKLEYLLEMCGLKPEDLGIRKSIGTPFPSEEELDEIMEGDE